RQLRYLPEHRHQLPDHRVRALPGRPRDELAAARAARARRGADNEELPALHDGHPAEGDTLSTVHERGRRGRLTPLLTRTLLVALGGLVGSVARYWLSGVVQQASGGEFPLGTLAVNILGSFVVGLVMALSLERGVIPANARILLATGLCGGFT